MGFNAVDEDGDRCHSLSLHRTDEPCQVRLTSDHVLTIQQDGHDRAPLICSEGPLLFVPRHVFLWRLEVAPVIWMKTACMIHSITRANTDLNPAVLLMFLLDTPRVFAALLKADKIAKEADSPG